MRKWIKINRLALYSLPFALVNSAFTLFVNPYIAFATLLALSVLYVSIHFLKEDIQNHIFIALNLIFAGIMLIVFSFVSIYVFAISFVATMLYYVVVLMTKKSYVATKTITESKTFDWTFYFVKEFAKFTIKMILSIAKMPLKRFLLPFFISPERIMLLTILIYVILLYVSVEPFKTIANNSFHFVAEAMKHNLNLN